VNWAEQRARTGEPQPCFAPAPGPSAQAADRQRPCRRDRLPSTRRPVSPSSTNLRNPGMAAWPPGQAAELGFHHRPVSHPGPAVWSGQRVLQEGTLRRNPVGDLLRCLAAAGTAPAPPTPGPAPAAGPRLQQRPARPPSPSRSPAGRPGCLGEGLQGDPAGPFLPTKPSYRQESGALPPPDRPAEAIGIGARWTDSARAVGVPARSPGRAGCLANWL